MKKSILLILLFSLCVQIVYACICDFGLFEDRIRKAPFVFTGKVIFVENIYSDGTSEWPIQQKILITVENKFKGNQNDTLTIHSDLSSCGSFFEEGGQYLVFAMHLIKTETIIDQNFIDTNSKIVTGKCYGTKKIENSENALQLLEKLFSSNYPIEEISSQKLYSDIWKDESFNFTDENPEFRSGPDSLESFIQNNLRQCSLPDKWPDSFMYDEFKDDSLFKELNMSTERVEPTFVWIHFDVSKTGSLNNFRVDEAFALNQGCNDEALRIAKLMPDWIPAKIKGVPVNTSHFIKVDFKSKSAY